MLFTKKYMSPVIKIGVQNIIALNTKLKNSRIQKCQQHVKY